MNSNLKKISTLINLATEYCTFELLKLCAFITSNHLHSTKRWHMITKWAEVTIYRNLSSPADCYFQLLPMGSEERNLMTSWAYSSLLGDKDIIKIIPRNTGVCTYCKEGMNYQRYSDSI